MVLTFNMGAYKLRAEILLLKGRTRRLTTKLPVLSLVGKGGVVFIAVQLIPSGLVAIMELVEVGPIAIQRLPFHVMFLIFPAPGITTGVVHVSPVRLVDTDLPSLVVNHIEPFHVIVLHSPPENGGTVGAAHVIPSYDSATPDCIVPTPLGSPAAIHIYPFQAIPYAILVSNTEQTRAVQFTPSGDVAIVVVLAVEGFPPTTTQ